MNIKKGDKIKIIAGKDRGKAGTILRALPASGRVVVDGLNIRKRHVRPRKSGQKGEIVQFPAPLHVSNVQLVCGTCGKAVRSGFQVQAGTKNRICRKCKAVV
jgi:large subunit ribosomal protein L24